VRKPQRPMEAATLRPFGVDEGTDPHPFGPAAERAYDVLTVADISGEDIEVQKNPPESELRRFVRDYGAVRIMRIDGDLYAWDAMKNTHDMMAMKLDLKPPSAESADVLELRKGKVVSTQQGSDDLWKTGKGVPVMQRKAAGGELEPLSKEENARYQWLEENYDKLTPEQKEEFSALSPRFDADWERGLQKQAKEEAEGAEKRRIERYKSIVKDTCEDLGFDSKRVDVVSGTYRFELNGVQRVAGGTCEISKGEAGRITMYSDHLMTDKSVANVLAHEIEHAKYQYALDQYHREWDAIMKEPAEALKGDGSLTEPYASKYPAYVAMRAAYFSTDGIKAFAAADGVSEYSYEYWLEWSKAEHKFGPGQSAIHETLAEMARIKYETGKFPEHMGERIISWRGGVDVPKPSNAQMSKNAKLWRDLYRAVDKVYKAGHK
jgi:hypothetical protein